jgi:hypothetical protein
MVICWRLVVVSRMALWLSRSLSHLDEPTTEDMVLAPEPSSLAVSAVLPARVPSTLETGVLLYPVSAVREMLTPPSTDAMEEEASLRV